MKSGSLDVLIFSQKKKIGEIFVLNIYIGSSLSRLGLDNANTQKIGRSKGGVPPIEGNF